MATTPSNNLTGSEVRILRSRRVPLGENAEDKTSERPANATDSVKRTPQQLITKFFNVVSSGRSTDMNATSKSLADASMLVNTSDTPQLNGTPNSGLNSSEINLQRSGSIFQASFSASSSKPRNLNSKQRNAVSKAMSSARRRLMVTDTPTSNSQSAFSLNFGANPSYSQPALTKNGGEAAFNSQPRSAEAVSRPRARANRRISVDPQAVINASRDRLERLKTWTSIENLLEEQQRELGAYVERAKRWKMSRGRGSTSLNVSFALPLVQNEAETEGPVDEAAIEREIRGSLETDDTVLLRRQKQLDYGKQTPAYSNYLNVVPKPQRAEDQPRTPNKFLKLARRDWDTRVRNWRRALHQFDTDASKSASGSGKDAELTATVLDENAMDVSGAPRSPVTHAQLSSIINERSNSMSNSLLGKRRAPHTPTGKSAATSEGPVSSPRSNAPRASVMHSELTQDLVRLSTVSEETCSSPAKRLRSSAAAAAAAGKK